MKHEHDENDWKCAERGFLEHGRRHLRGFGLKYWVMTIVTREASTGAMIMDRVEQMSMGHWRPSPGQVYPLLDQMSTDGYLKVDNKEGKKFYSPTDKGRDLLEGSWFPWRMVDASGGFEGIEGAIGSMETLTEYIIDNREKIAENETVKKKISNIIDRLKSI